MEASPLPSKDEAPGRSSAQAKRLSGDGTLRNLWAARSLLEKRSSPGLLQARWWPLLIPSRYPVHGAVDAAGFARQRESRNAGCGLTAKSGSGMGGVAGDLLGIGVREHYSQAILGSRTVQDRLIARFQLHQVYGSRWSRIREPSSLKHRDFPKTAKAESLPFPDGFTIQNVRGYRASLCRRTQPTGAELSTSAAHRERVFLEERLRNRKQDLDGASQKIQPIRKHQQNDRHQGTSARDGAGSAAIEGELVATESELKGAGRDLYAKQRASSFAAGQDWRTPAATRH